MKTHFSLPLFGVCALLSLGTPSGLLGSDPTPQADTSQPSPASGMGLAALPTSGSALQQAVTTVPAPEAWRISAGYQWRQMGSLGWRPGSLAAHAGLPSLVGRAGHSSSDFSIPSLGIGDHFYSDGYVRPDAGSAHTGTTQFWGYSSNSQFDSADFFVAFHANLNSSQSMTTVSGSSGTGPGWSSELESSGIFTSVESPELYAFAFGKGSVSLSLEGGYSFAQDDTSRFAGNVFQDLQRSITVTTLTNHGFLTDDYSTNGMKVPGAPYSGTLTGGGPQIDAAPLPLARTITPGTGAQTTSTSSLTALLHSDAVEGFSLDLHTFSLGPKLAAELEGVRLGLGTGLALNVASWEANSLETLYASQNGGSRAVYEWTRHASGTDVLAGFYLESTCQISLSRNVALYVACRYDWSKGMTVGAGPSSFQFDPGGWSVLSGLTVSF